MARGAKLSGRILIQGYDCSQVELDGVNLYSSRLHNGDKVWETEYPWIYVENHTGIRRVHKFMEDNWDGVECFVVGDLSVCEKIVDVD